MAPDRSIRSAEAILSLSSSLPLILGVLLLSAWAGPTAALAAVPDARRGEQLHARCLACHALAYDRVGPRHCGLIGRRAGSVADFAYSLSMANSHIVWTARALDRFLVKPLAMVPGSSMTYDGVPDARDRADLIAYLERVDHTPACAAAPPH